MIIGLGFRARSGKDLIADYLVKEYGFTKVAFADSLKVACQEIFHLTEEQTYGNKKEIVDPYWGVTPRYILQKVGTECMRNGYADDIWVRSLDAKIQKNPGWYVVTDVRFPNEAEAINEWGGLVVRVDRSQAGASGGIEKHQSEIAMESYDKWNYVLNNDGTIEELFARVDEFMKEWW